MTTYVELMINTTSLVINPRFKLYFFALLKVKRQLVWLQPRCEILVFFTPFSSCHIWHATFSYLNCIFCPSQSETPIFDFNPAVKSSFFFTPFSSCHIWHATFSSKFRCRERWAYQIMWQIRKIITDDFHHFMWSMIIFWHCDVNHSCTFSSMVLVEETQRKYWLFAENLHNWAT
jgi:hypothetical protein